MGLPVFLTAQSFTRPPKSYALQCFSTDQPPPKVSHPVGTSTLPYYVMHVPCTHRPNLQLDPFSRFSTAHVRRSIYFTMYVRLNAIIVIIYYVYRTQSTKYKKYTHKTYNSAIKKIIAA